MPEPAIARGPDNQPRCAWCLATPRYLAYHDTEWGFPTADDRRLFEKLCLEGFQSGLSWRTILDKREGFRQAFARFDIDTLAHWGEAEVGRLLANHDIVRHRGKIAAALNNARRAQELVRSEGSLARYFWRFEPAPEDLAAHRNVSTSPRSLALSKDLKKRGWKFVGPTTTHSFLQSMGFINDHAEGCVIRARAAAARAVFQPPR